MTVTLRVVRRGRPTGLRLKTAEDAFQVMRPKARGLDREYVWRLDLGSRDELLGCELVAIGSLTAAIVEPREVFKGAILGNAASIILCHSHPSQDVRPSRDDKKLTLRLGMIGHLMGIPLADHIILADDRYFSFKESGLI